MAYSIVFLLSLLLFLFYISNALPEEQIFYDYMDDTTAIEWTKGGNAVIPSAASQCSPQNYCFELNSGGWVERAFSTKGYHSVYFTLTLDGSKSSTVDIKIYDNDWLVSDIEKNFGISEEKKIVPPPQTNDWDDIDVFVIRFAMENSATVYMDRLELIGISITTAPTSYPTKYPTITSSNPTNYPTYSTSIPTTKPTLVPTLIPSKTPSKYPTAAPTQTKSDGAVDDEYNTPTDSGNNDTNINNTNNASNDKNDSLVTIVVICSIAAIILLFVIMFFLYYKRKKNDNKEPGALEMHNVVSSSDIQNENVSNAQNVSAEGHTHEKENENKNDGQNIETAGRWYSPTAVNKKQEDDIYSDEINGVEPIIKKEDKWKHAYFFEKTPQDGESIYNDNNNKQPVTTGNNSGQTTNGDELPKGDSDNNNNEHNSTQY